MLSSNKVVLKINALCLKNSTEKNVRKIILYRNICIMCTKGISQNTNNEKIKYQRTTKGAPPILHYGGGINFI